MDNMLIDGVYVPLTTPFYRNGASYRKKLEHNVGRYSLTPAAGLVVLGSGGEATTLSDAEVVEILAAVSEAAAPEKVLVAGLECGSVYSALGIAEKAAKAGFDAVLAGTPLDGLRLTSAERTLFLQAVADASPLPVLLHSGELALPLETAIALAHHPNIIGLFDEQMTPSRYAALVETTRDVRHDVTVTKVFAPVTRRMKTVAGPEGNSFVSAASLGGGAAVAVAPPAAALKNTRTKTVGFQIMSAGSAATLAPLLQAGVAGAMPALAACAPQAVHEVYAAFKDGNPALAAEKSDRLIAADTLMAELGVAGVKYACDLNGYYGGAPRLPRLPLNGDQRTRVEQVMAGLKN